MSDYFFRLANSYASSLNLIYSLAVIPGDINKRLETIAKIASPEEMELLRNQALEAEREAQDE